MKKVETLEVAIEKKSFVGIKTGRPVNANSKRQQRLAELNAKIEAGVTIQRGRPVSTDSERQKRIAELEAKRANGELRRGRPKKQSDDISLIDILKTVHK